MSGPLSRQNEAANRLNAVRERIVRAAERSGRDPGEVTLVAVSKTQSAARVIELAEAGQRVFGENRVQEAREKIPEVAVGWSGPPLLWRLVGHLQRNKVRPALDLFPWLDGVDSIRLLEELEMEAGRRAVGARVLLQFNCSGEATKSGFQPGDVEALAGRLGDLRNVEIGGLMTIGPLDTDPESARPAFRRLREIRDELSERTGRSLAELSMGMSGDLETGIEEGATLVRVGTALFGARE
jgi:hypothetical protein